MPNTQLMLFIILVGIALGIAILTELVHIPILDGVLAVLALLLTLVAFLTKNYIYLFEPVVKKKGKALVLNSGEAFVLSSTGNAVVRREGINVYGSAFVKIPIYKSGTDMTKDEKTEISKLFGRILTISKSPVKLSSQLYVVDKDAYIAKLSNMLNLSEERYRSMQTAGGDQHKAAMDRARGEVTMWRNLLDSVSKSQAQSLMVYAMVTAIGGNEEEATNIAYQRAEELAGGISTILGITASVATGQELLLFLEPEYMIPVETVSERIRQKTMGGT